LDRSRAALAAVLLVYSALYAFPILSPPQLDRFAADLAVPILLVVLLATLQAERNRASHVEEHRFWGLLSVSFACWLMGSIVFVDGGLLELLDWLSFVVDSLFLISYLFLLLALDQKPHLGSGWSAGNLSYSYGVIGSLMMQLCLMTYFYMIPLWHSGLDRPHSHPIDQFVIALDLVLTIRLVHLVAICRSDSWRLVYLWMAVFGGVWLLTDSTLFLIELERMDLPYGTVADFLWYIPLFGLAWLVRTERQVRGAASSGPPDPAAELPFDRTIPEVLLIYAFVLPAVHLAGYGAAILDESYRTQREFLVLAALVAFVALAVRQHHLLQGRAQRMGERITDLVSNEQVLEAQKLEAIGRLAGGVAHDFNNLLTVVASHAELLRSRLASGDPLQRSVSEIALAAERGSTLTRQLLGFSRQQLIQPQLLDLNRLLAESQPLIQRLIGERIELQVVLARADCWIQADPGQALQVLLNLCTNARDALPEGGRVRVETDCAIAARERVPGSGEPLEYVVLRVSDNGHGIARELQARIFEPYFTTRTRGTGLGLATVHGIVRQSGGQVRVHSRVGEGTTFEVLLPRCPPPAAEPHEVAPVEVAATGSGEVILLVEDQKIVRRALGELLRQLGYQVVEAETGEAAIKLALERSNRVDLVLTDIEMPAMTGWQLAGRLRSRWPELPVLFVSGYPESIDQADPALDRRSGFLAKPFGQGELLAQIQRLLGRPPMRAG
jgi:signal transduction histidine kinase/ActR/RegA family two-component response regulator